MIDHKPSCTPSVLAQTPTVPSQRVVPVWWTVCACLIIVVHSYTGHASAFLEWSNAFDLSVHQEEISQLLVDSGDVRRLHAELVSR